MTDVMQSYYRGQSLHEAVDREFMSNVMAAVVADMTHQVKKVIILKLITIFLHIFQIYGTYGIN